MKLILAPATSKPAAQPHAQQQQRLVVLAQLDPSVRCADVSVAAGGGGLLISYPIICRHDDKAGGNNYASDAMAELAVTAPPGFRVQCGGSAGKAVAGGGASSSGVRALMAGTGRLVVIADDGCLMLKA